MKGLRVIGVRGKELRGVVVGDKGWYGSRV